MGACDSFCRQILISQLKASDCGMAGYETLGVLTICQGNAIAET